MRSHRRWIVVTSTLALAGCGGGSGGPGTGPTPPPPPPPPAATRVDLAPGEMRVLTDASEIASFEIAGASAARQYQVILMSGSQVEGFVAPITFRANATGASPSIGVARSDNVAGAPDRRGPRAGHIEMMRRMREEIRRVNPRISPRALASSASGAATSLAVGSVPAVGEMITLKSQILPGGAITCASSTAVAGVVTSVGANFIILEDLAVTGHLTTQDYADLESELDAFVAPVVQQFFGAPPDLDGNGRVIVFFTGEVNRSGDAIGFFSPLDMFDPADCASSNEGEILWLIGPDPNGDISDDDYTAQEVKDLARGLVAHEFQHLLGNFQRFLGGAAEADDIWIDEGLSHVSSEVAGLFRIGAETRSSLGFSEIGTGAEQRSAFFDFHEGNLGNTGVYLAAPHEVPALASLFDDPDRTDSMRGWGYLFLRWLADRYAGATPESIVGGSAEHLFFREVAGGGPTHMTGVANLLRSVAEVSGETPSWEDLLSEYFVAPALVGAESVPAGIPFETWDFGRLYSEMAAASIPELSSGFPLSPVQVAMGTGASAGLSFNIGASTARYFRFQAAGTHPDTRVGFTTPSGAPLPGAPRARVIIVRTR